MPDPLAPLLADFGAQLRKVFDQPAPTPPGGLVLSAAEVRALDEYFGLGATVNGLALIKAIDRLASIKIGDIRIPFTPGQLSELQHRAQKRGRTVEQEMRAVVARIEDELFYKGG